LLSLLAYLGMGSGFAGQFVYCFGADGHRAVERVHVIGDGAVEGRHGSGLSTNSAAQAEACTDMPLLAAAASEQKKVSRTFSTSYVAVSYLSYSDLDRVPLAYVNDLGPVDIQDCVFRRTTVLQV